MPSLQTLRRFHALAGRLAPGWDAELARRQMMRPRRLPPRDWETAAAAGAERVTLRFGLSALRWGAADAPVVLALHGWEGRATQFAAFVPALRDAGLQLLALEAPGHGASPGRESHAIAFAEALLEAAAELPPLQAVIGHSMGGGAAAYALSRGLRTERAVLLGAPASLQRVLERYSGFVGLRPAARARFIARVHRHTGVDPASVDIAQLAAGYRTPALIVHDRNDHMVPYEDGQTIARHWPGSQLLTTAGLGHWRILRNAGVVERVARFVGGDPALARAA